MFKLLSLFISLSAAQTPAVHPLIVEVEQAYAKTKWSKLLFAENSWREYREKTPQGRALIYYVCGEHNGNTTLIFSAVHGDEITPVYFGLRLISWIKGEPDLCRDHRIVVAPIVNPDGALAAKPTRVNSQGVDLNRNFPTGDFDENAVKFWKEKFKSDLRRFPGNKAASEVETRFQQYLIDEYKPKKILSVHSPLGFFDYDGPEDALQGSFKKEYLKACGQLKLAVKHASNNYNFLKFGYFTGSLGHYAGKEMGIPTLTLELPSTDALKAKSYFEALKKGTRALITYKISN